MCIVALRHLTHPNNVRENVTELKGKRKDGPPLTSDYITPWKGGGVGDTTKILRSPVLSGDK